MNLILDTHALVWFVRESERLSFTALKAILSTANTIHVSPVSFYEIALKMNFGKLRIEGGLDAIRETVETRQFVELKLSIAHCVLAAALDLRHRDPFDRMLAAQAIADDMVLITVDRAYGLFNAKTLW